VLLVAIPQARTADDYEALLPWLARHSDGEAALHHNFFGHLASARRPHYFFARYSAAISDLDFFM
jgi:hypothetical protein